VDPAGFYANPDPALGGTSRGMAAAYTGGSPEQFPERYARIASATHITAAAPATLIIVGEADHLVPVAGAYRFTERARAAGVDVNLVAVPYADHVFDGRRGSIGEQAYRQLTARWLRDHGQGPSR
jgi:acetyl esterase/lipase